MGDPTFLRGIRPKVTVIAQLKFELASFEATVKHFNHNASMTPPKNHSLS